MFPVASCELQQPCLIWQLHVRLACLRDWLHRHVGTEDVAEHISLFSFQALKAFILLIKPKQKTHFIEQELL